MSTEYQEDKKPINQVQYASKDFPSFFDSLLARLRDQYGEDYNDFASSSVGIMFVNLMSYAMDQLSWYLDRRSSESYLATARTLDSVTRLASQIGYKPKRASASSVDLSITFPALQADTIMSAGFGFTGPGSLGFQLMNDVLLSVGQTSAVITVSEGEVRTQSFTSSGEPAQIFILPGVKEGEYVADQSVRVFINGLEWKENDFLTYEQIGQFAVSYTTDPPRITFGDGSAGNIPERGAEIRIEYRIIHAEEGNVRSNTITTATDDLIVAGEIVSLETVTNIEPASGGSGPQSISEIKRIAPLAFQAGGSAVTQQDYYAIVNSFSDPVYGSVSKGYAGVTRETVSDEYTSSRLLYIENTTGIFRSSTQTTTDEINSDQVQINSSAVDAQEQLRNIEDTVDLASAELTSITNTLEEVRNKTASATGSLSRVQSLVGDANTLIGELETLLEGVANLDPNITAKVNQISDKISEIDTLNTSSKGNTLDVQAIAGTQIPSLVSTVAERVSLIKSTSTTLRTVNLVSVVDNSGTTVTAIQAHNDASESLKTQFVTIIGELRTHLDSLFDDSCKANVVTVPILVEGREGFYQAPSRGLMRALQNHLNEVKEVTHLVRVVSGATALVPASVNLKVKFNSSFVKSEVRAEIESGIDALLRRRDFSVPLYVSDIYNVVELVDGVDHVNITINNPVERLDSDGNLVVRELEVVTKGTVTIEEVA